MKEEAIDLLTDCQTEWIAYCKPVHLLSEGSMGTSYGVMNFVTGLHVFYVDLWGPDFVIVGYDCTDETEWSFYRDTKLSEAFVECFRSATMAMRKTLETDKHAA